MKFGKVLQSTAECFPEKHFICYKTLKKILKSAVPSTPPSNDDSTVEHDSANASPLPSTSKNDGQNRNAVLASRVQFMRILNQELHLLNTYFIGQEEEMVIRLQIFESALQDSKPENKQKLSGPLVRFHGEIVELQHWGILNFAAIAKILKKHDKCIPADPIRRSLLETVMQQPFYSTELLEKLAKQCEKMISDLGTEGTKEGPSDLMEMAVEYVMKDDAEFAGLKKMLHALKTWRDLGDNAHTPSTVLPYSKPIPRHMLGHSNEAGECQKRTHNDDSDQEQPSKIARIEH